MLVFILLLFFDIFSNVGMLTIYKQTGESTYQHHYQLKKEKKKKKPHMKKERYGTAEEKN